MRLQSSHPQDARGLDAYFTTVEAVLALLDLDRQLTQKKKECDTARLAPKRLANYSVKLGADYQCPRCWIDNEARSALRPIPGTEGGSLQLPPMRLALFDKLPLESAAKLSHYPRGAPRDPGLDASAAPPCWCVAAVRVRHP